YLLLVANHELAPDLRPKAGPSDLVQETFLEAQRDFAQFHGSSADELRAWLRRLLLNNAAALSPQYRGTAQPQVGRERPLEAGDSEDDRRAEPAAETPSPSSLAAATEQNEALQKALAQLPEDYRTVIALRHQEQLAFEEIGRRMGRTPNAARMLWTRA